MFNTLFFSSENRAVYEIMSKNVVEPDVTKYDKMWHVRWARPRALAPTRTHVRPRTHPRAHAQKNIIYILLFHGNNDSWRLLKVMLYVHCLSCDCVLHIRLISYVYRHWITESQRKSFYDRPVILQYTHISWYKMSDSDWAFLVGRFARVDSLYFW